jgi:hypothetical protein
VPAPTRNNLLPVFQSLSEQYGLGTEMQFASPGNVDEQPIEQEYQAYVTALLSPHSDTVAGAVWNGSVVQKASNNEWNHC